MEVSLVILAAGLGSRFGGLKQLEPVGPNKEFIIDYSVYDAIEAGFNHVVFIIKKENYELFKQTIGSRVEKKVKVSYVFQDINDVPDDYQNIGRIKPWGTAHALMSAKDVVNGNFLVINADDYYGKESYKIAYEYLKNKDLDECISVLYKVQNTMSDFGSVKRGICQEENGYLVSIEESKIEKVDGKIIACPIYDEDNKRQIPSSTYVSMNMFGFTKDIFDFLSSDINNFFEANKNDLSVKEYLLPDVVLKCGMKVKFLQTSSSWLGLTYKEDTPKVKNTFKEYLETGLYPEKLF